MGPVGEVLKDAPLECGACNKCCRKNPGIFLIPEHGDDPGLYEGHLDVIDGRPILKTKSNGDCIYFDLEKGCTNYNNRPNVCRIYDCRSDYMQWLAKPRTERRAMMKSGLLNQSVQKEGRQRLKAVLSRNASTIAAD
tara:strand:- start:69 stop:479 length:411 start_codon:yes stop_codon:yes gene_type:complete